MKAFLFGTSVLLGLMPGVSFADVSIQLRARVEARCEVISLEATEGSADVIVRAACNVPRYTLVLQGAGEVVSAASAEAATVGGPGPVVTVDLDRPGFQTIAIKLEQPVGSVQDLAPLIAFG